MTKDKVKEFAKKIVDEIFAAQSFHPPKKPTIETIDVKKEEKEEPNKQAK